MSAKVGQKKRLIQVTEANVRNGHLYLTGHLGFFPAACFGASSKKGPLGQMLTLEVTGLKTPVMTDIPTESEGGEPRKFFRNRAWVREFFRVSRIKAGDYVMLEKLDRFRIRVSPATAKDIRSHMEITTRRGLRRERSESSSASNGDGSMWHKSYRWPTKAPMSEYHAASVPDPDGLASIQEVNWSSFRTIDLFAGIGGIRLGFQEVGGRGVFASEWDQLAAVTYEANFGEKPHGDITQVDPRDIPDHDVLLAGFPCQPFSIIGERKGFGDTRGTLFFSVEQILREKRPPAALLENVKQFKTHDGGRTFRTVIDRLAALGYYTHTAVLNAWHYGVPQKRERTFIVCFRADLAFEFPRPEPAMPSLNDVLEPEDQVDPKFIATERIQVKRLQRLREQGVTPFYPSVWHENKGGAIGIHPFSCALRHNASHNYLLVNGRRRLTSRECLRLQGFPDSYKIVVDHRAIRAQAGNSVAVPVIRAIAKQMVHSLRSAELRSGGSSPLLFCTTGE
ncbi:MAG: DNA cytosine methyltransferase [Phycisphaeraceae bacterium]|nr:DNA cytosine methyltransferase [Phycisphaeraceae bacterium]MBX3367684.1 DNA cytosine methyltransferase [Phycisphaeraceae bacterium]